MTEQVDVKLDALNLFEKWGELSASDDRRRLDRIKWSDLRVSCIEIGSAVVTRSVSYLRNLHSCPRSTHSGAD
jgi:hypothetical protein